MRPLILLALLFSVAVAFNIFRDDGIVPEEQLLTVRHARDASDSDSSDSDEKNAKETEGSGSGDADEEQLRRVARDVEEASGEGSGFEVTSAPLRFIRSADVEGSGSGAEADE